jgi:transcriptional regulator with XRE-family HTH domain
MVDILSKAFAENVRRFRLERNLNQVQLAREMGIAQSAVSKMESGEVEPELSTVCKVAYALRIDPIELLKPTNS